MPNSPSGWNLLFLFPPLIYPFITSWFCPSLLQVGSPPSYLFNFRLHKYTLLFVKYNFINSFSVPPNGLVIYCGTIVTDEGKEKKVNIDFEPFKPINTSLYLCDNKVFPISFIIYYKLFYLNKWLFLVSHGSIDSVVGRW